MHGLGHGIGLDVHDPDQAIPLGTLAAGSAYSIDAAFALPTSVGDYWAFVQVDAAALVADTDDHFSLRTEPPQPPAILWRGHEVAKLVPGG